MLLPEENVPLANCRIEGMATEWTEMAAKTLLPFVSLRDGLVYQSLRVSTAMNMFYIYVTNLSQLSSVATTWTATCTKLCC